MRDITNGKVKQKNTKPPDLLPDVINGLLLRVWPSTVLIGLSANFFWFCLFI